MLIEGCWNWPFATCMEAWAARFETTFCSSAASLSSPSKFAVGLPESAFSLRAVLMGTAPRKGVLVVLAIISAPPLPKMSYSLPSSPMK